MQVSHIWVICGGVSAEHEISILSAQNVVRVLREEGFILHVVIISKQGMWYYLDNNMDFSAVRTVSQAQELGAQLLCLTPGAGSVGKLVEFPDTVLPCDCVFPLVHGSQGEDGVLQGVLSACNVPFVGSGVLSSALCMSKHVAKALLNEAGIATTPAMTVTVSALRAPSFCVAEQELGLPIFVKPSSQGSSVGVSKAVDEASYLHAIEEAFQFDDVVLLEQAIEGREIECSVMGNLTPRVSLPGEVICESDYYSYQAKYLDSESARVVTPADLNDSQIDKLQSTALEVYKILHCCGMARVDLFLKDDDSVYVNEVNTIPGFTDISMFAKNWQASGVSYAAVLTELIHHALAAFEQNQQVFFDCSKAVNINEVEDVQ